MAENQGQSTQTDQGKEGQEPKYLTNEEVNKAITARLKGIEKKLDDTTSNLSSSLREELKKTLDEFRSSSQTSDKSSSTAKESPEILGLRRQIAEGETRLKRMEEERNQERDTARDTRLRQQLGEELSRYGVDQKHLHHAVGFLADSQKRVKWNEDGNSVIFRDDDGSEIDLKTGLRGWIQSDDGKLYLPPRGTSGTGGRPTRKAGATPGGSETFSKEEVSDALRKMFEQ